MKLAIIKFLKNKSILFFLTLLFMNLLLFCKNPKEEMGDQIIHKINSYIETNNKLPERLSDLGIEEKKEGPIYYLQKNTKGYIIWYELPTGKSRVYDSTTKNWN